MAIKKDKKTVPVGDTGFYETTVEDMLDLTPEEMIVIDLKLDMARQMKALREAQGLTQAEAAKRAGTAQGRWAMAEGHHETVGFDFYIKALLSLGADRATIAQAVKGVESKPTGKRRDRSTALPVVSLGKKSARSRKTVAA